MKVYIVVLVEYDPYLNQKNLFASLDKEKCEQFIDNLTLTDHLCDTKVARNLVKVYQYKENSELDISLSNKGETHLWIQEMIIS